MWSEEIDYRAPEKHVWSEETVSRALEKHVWSEESVSRAPKIQLEIYTQRRNYMKRNKLGIKETDCSLWFN